MNILVTGANGQLGNEMRRLGAVSPNNYIFTDVAELDITNAEAVMYVAKHYSIDAIINCAAYTNVDKAESDEATAELINATAVANLAVAMKEVGGTLFHVSTDYVFGSEGNTPRTEEMPLNPLGVYGRTKLHGEQAILESGCKAWQVLKYNNLGQSKYAQLGGKALFDSAPQTNEAIAELVGNINSHLGSSFVIFKP